MDEILKSCRKVLKALEWCHQWLDGDDAKKVGKDIRAFKAAIKKQTFRSKSVKSRTITLRDCTVLRNLCNDRIQKMQKAQAAGDLWPAIWAAQIEEIEVLFQKVTGYPFEEVPDA